MARVTEAARGRGVPYEKRRKGEKEAREREDMKSGPDEGE